MTDPTNPRPGTRLGDLMLDVSAIVGAGLMIYGFALIYPPAAYIFAGIVLSFAAWLTARKSA